MRFVLSPLTSFFFVFLFAMQSVQIDIPFNVATVNGGEPGICKSGEQDMHESLLVVLLFLTSRSNLSEQAKQMTGILVSLSLQMLHNVSAFIFSRVHLNPPLRPAVQMSYAA